MKFPKIREIRSLAIKKDKDLEIQNLDNNGKFRKTIEDNKNLYESLDKTTCHLKKLFQTGSHF